MPNSPTSPEILGPFRVGQRVRHWAQQYTTGATATVIALESVIYVSGRPGIEVQVRNDKPWPRGNDDETERWWPVALTVIVE